MDSLIPTQSTSGKRARDGEEDAAEESAKRLRAEFLLGILDDADDDRSPPEAPPAGDLDSVVRSLEEEIGLGPGPAPAATPAGELGFLLEASDDELGLPPTADEEAAGGGFWGFDGEISNCYDGLDLGFGGEPDEEAALPFDAGLFEDFGDASYSLLSDLWLPEGLPAV